MNESKIIRAVALVLACGCSGKLGAPGPASSVGGPSGSTNASEADPVAAAPAAADLGPPAEYQGPDGQTCALPPAGIWHLTGSQYQNTLQALLPSVDVSGLGERLGRTMASGVGFSNERALLHMGEGHVAEVFELAKEVAERAAADPAQLSPCLSQGADDACVTGFVREFGTRALRGPLSADEESAYLALYQAQLAEHGAQVALRQLLSAFLMSSRFLYRTELGPSDAATAAITLTPYERAAALSYFISDGPPDELLRAAAGGDGLNTPEQVAEQTRRLLAERQLSQGLHNFFAEYLNTEAVLLVRKDKKLFPGYQDGQRAHMQRETEEFAQYVLHDGQGTFGELLTANYTIGNSVIAELYGASGPASEQDWQRIELDAAQRSGFLTQLGWLSVFAHEDATDMIRRGKFVREQLLCQTLPPPPENVDVLPIEPKEDRTLRELLDEHSSKPQCAACHSLMDPIGYAFENYDAVGQWRETEPSGLPLQAATEIIEVDGASITVNTAVELAQALASSREAQLCFMKKAYTYAHGGLDQRVDGCALNAASEAVVASGGDLVEAVVAITTAPNFFSRARSLAEGSP